MAGLCIPLSTLRPWCYHHRRMTRGQDGSLFLSCAALSSATPCRFIPALSLTPASGGMAGISTALPQDVPSAIFGNPSTLAQFHGTQFTMEGLG